MTTDAQGIFIFIFTLPLMLILSGLTFYILKKFLTSSKIYYRSSQLISMGILFFCIASLVPILNQIPINTVNSLAKTFTKIVGKTPRQYFKDRNDLYKLIQSELSTNDGRKIDFSKISTANQWTRVCIFTPYTSDAIADQLVGSHFNLSQYSDVASSDSIHTIALFNETSLVNYANLSRSIIDFEFTNSICVLKEIAIFQKQSNHKFK